MKFLSTTGVETLSRLAKQKFVAASDLDLVYILIQNTNNFVPRGTTVKVNEIYYDDSLPSEWCLHCIGAGITAIDGDNSNNRIYTLQFSPDIVGTITVSYVTPYTQTSYYYIREVGEILSMSTSTHVTNTDMVIIRLSVPNNIDFETAKQYLKINLVADEDYRKYLIELNEYFAIDRPTINDILGESYTNSDTDVTAIDFDTIDSIINQTYVTSEEQQDILSDEDIDLILS